MKTYSQESKIKILPWIVTIAMFMQMLDTSVLNTALPSIAFDLGENPLQMQIVVIAYMLSVAVFLPVSGWLADKFGIKKIFLFAVGVFTFGSILCALSQSLTALSVSRVIQGIGGGLLVPTGRLAVLKAYPRSKYVKVLSFIVLPALIGPLLGPTVGGILVEYASWHWIFLINIPAGIACIVATIYAMPYIKPAEKTKLDISGFLIFDMAVLLFFAMSAPQDLIYNIPRIYFFLAALFLIALYCLTAKTKKNPLFHLEMFKIQSFSVGMAGTLFVRLVGGALPFLAPLFFQTALGFSPSKSGMALLPMGIAAMIAKPIVNIAISKIGYKKFLISNTIFLSLFVSAIYFITPATPYYVILILYMFIGMANSFQFTTINTLSLIDVPDRFISGANSMLSVIMQISMALGVAFSALLLSKVSYFAGDTNIQGNNLLASFHMTYLIIGLFSFVSAFLFILVPKKAGTYIKDDMDLISQK